MGREELLAKRPLRLAGYFKDTREPRGPEHMVKMKNGQHQGRLLGPHRTGGAPAALATNCK